MSFQLKTASKNYYVQLELFEDMMTRFIFISWLAKQIGRKANYHFKSVREEDKTLTQQNSLKDINHQNIYSYWLKHENSIESVDKGMAVSECKR